MPETYCLSCMEPLARGARQCGKCGWPDTAPEQPPFALPLGTELHNGKYLVGSVLGQGGFGITYFGTDQALHIKVTIKEYYLKTASSRSGTCVDFDFARLGGKRNFGPEAMGQESQILADIRNIPSIVRILDYFQENNTSYIVMDYVEGTTLQSLIQKGGRMEPEGCVRMLTPIMEALAGVHCCGFIHRDICPANIILDKNGNPWLLDFGAAMDLSRARDSLFIPADRRGYSPPEQNIEMLVGPWTDVYSLCAVLYYCTTGRTVPEILQRNQGEKMYFPDRYPKRIKTAIQKGLALRKRDRLPSVESLMIQLNGRKQRKKFKLLK